MLSLFSVEEDGGKERLAHAMIENAAVCDVRYLYTIYIYILEGKDPMILSAHRVFVELDAVAGVNNVGQHEFQVPPVEKITRKAMSLLNEAREPIASAVEGANVLVLAVESELKTKEDNLAELLSNRSCAGQVSRRSNREVARTIFTHSGRIVTNIQEKEKGRGRGEGSKENCY